MGHCCNGSKKEDIEPSSNGGHMMINSLNNRCNGSDLDPFKKFTLEIFHY